MEKMASKFGGAGGSMGSGGFPGKSSFILFFFTLCLLLGSMGGGAGAYAANDLD